MTNKLPVSDVVSVDVNLSPRAAAIRNFGTGNILGSTDVLAPGEGARLYSTIDDVAADFGTDDPEYKAAQVYFSQSPRPGAVYISRWASTATAAVLNGGVLAEDARDALDYTDVTDGSMTIAIDGTDVDVSGVDLSGVTNMNMVATAIGAQLGANGEIRWNATIGRFEVQATSTGSDSSIGYASPGATGTDLSSLFRLDSDTASQPIPGVDEEDLEQAVLRQLDVNDWYGLYVASHEDADDDQMLNVASLIEAASPSRILAVTVQDTRCLDPNDDQSLGYRLNDAGYARTYWQYDSDDQHAALSAMARAFTVDFNGQNTTITLKFKQQPAVTPENLTGTQARAIDDKNGNVFVAYDNDTAILQQGTMANGDYFDERHGLDWLQNYIQTNLYNLLYQAQTKVPHTDPGVNLLLTNVERSCAQAVTNGLLAPGVWNSETTFGTLASGDTLSKGYYAYAPSVDTQPQAERDERRAPTIQIAAKLAGAVHSADVIVNVNR